MFECGIIAAYYKIGKPVGWIGKARIDHHFYIRLYKNKTVRVLILESSLDDIHCHILQKQFTVNWKEHGVTFVGPNRHRHELKSLISALPGEKCPSVYVSTLVSLIIVWFIVCSSL